MDITGFFSLIIHNCTANGIVCVKFWELQILVQLMRFPFCLSSVHPLSYEEKTNAFFLNSLYIVATCKVHTSVVYMYSRNIIDDHHLWLPWPFSWSFLLFYERTFVVIAFMRYAHGRTIVKEIIFSKAIDYTGDQYVVIGCCSSARVHLMIYFMTVKFLKAFECDLLCILNLLCSTDNYGHYKDHPLFHLITFYDLQS